MCRPVFKIPGKAVLLGNDFCFINAIADEFLEKFKKKVEQLKSGDPMDEDTYIGVQAREDLAEDLDKQVKESVKKGAKILMGGNRNAAYYEPTILPVLHHEMPMFNEETFGPAIGVTTFDTDEEAIDLINDTKFGLGVSLFTKDLEKVKKMIPQIEDGAVFVNELVKSDPRLPFGGTKKSGYGRELSFYGIREFVNVQTVYINK